eukprot:COSAG03_NODE_8687_length_779_cov_515.430882_1_plen_55_part_10
MPSVMGGIRPYAPHHRLPQRTAPILARGACIISISYACGTFLRSIFPKSNSGGLI